MERPLSPSTGKRCREKVKEYLESLKGSIFYNEQIKGPIVVTSRGIKKVISLSGDPKKLAALSELPRLLENMTLISVEKDRHNNPDIIEIIRGKIIVEIQGEKHLFNLILKRTKSNGIQFYDIAAHIIK